MIFISLFYDWKQSQKVVRQAHHERMGIFGSVRPELVEGYSASKSSFLR